MIHFRKPPEKVVIPHRGLVSMKYPFMNLKVAKEISHTTKYKEERVKDVMNFWNEFLDMGMKKDHKIKIPYIGSFQLRPPYREKDVVEQLDDIDFDEVTFEL